MAGEWIPLDCNLGTKPEVLELVDVTGLPVEVVGWRLIQLWSWASMNTADGTIRATASRIATACGGDEAFWLAVASVGWLRFDGPQVTIEGWDKRFSKAAKARLEDARRKAAQRAARPLSEICPEKIGLEEKRGEEKREEILPAAPVPPSKPPKASCSPAKPSLSWSADAGWQGITDADRQGWAVAYPAAVVTQELAKAEEWLRSHPSRAVRKNWRKFLTGWLSRCQERGGTVREPGRRHDEKPPPKAWRDEYQPAPYRTPKEVAALAAGLKLTEDT
jgi:hypothetical protein